MSPVPAAFIALLAPRLTTLRMRAVALTSGVIALATVPIVPVGAPILIGGLDCGGAAPGVRPMKLWLAVARRVCRVCRS